MFFLSDQIPYFHFNASSEWIVCAVNGTHAKIGAVAICKRFFLMVSAIVFLKYFIIYYSFSINFGRSRLFLTMRDMLNHLIIAFPYFLKDLNYRMQYKLVCAYHMPKPYRHNSYTTDVFSAFMCSDRVIFWKVFNGITLFVAKYLLTCNCSIKQEGVLLWHILDSK